MNEAALRAKLTPPRLIAIVVVQLVLDLALTRYLGFWDYYLRLVALAILLSQLSLLTIWAVVVAKTPLVRFTIPTIGMVGIWYLLSLILPWGIGEEASAGWALALLVQVFTIFIGCESYRLLRSRLVAKDTNLGDSGLASPMRYGIGTLMLWTTVVGMVFGFIQFGIRYWQWSDAIFQWEILAAIPFIGMINGLVAAIWLWAFAKGGLIILFTRILTSAVIAGGLSVIQFYTTEWLTGSIVITLRESLILVVVQSIILSAFLAVAWSISVRDPKIG